MGRPTKFDQVEPVLKTKLHKRMAPPKHLTAEESAEWNKVINTMPVNWFSEANCILLEQLCCHISTLRSLTKTMNEMRSRGNDKTSLYMRVVRQRQVESRMIARLQQVMRLSQHSIIKHSAINRHKPSGSSDPMENGNRSSTVMDPMKHAA